MSFVSTLRRVSALCLLAGSAAASTVPAASADAAVPVTPYANTAGYRPLAPDTATPDRGWREQNRLVGSLNSMMLTMGDAGSGHAHTGHQADPHAGHHMPGASTPGHDHHAAARTPACHSPSAKAPATASGTAPATAAGTASNTAPACTCCGKDGAGAGAPSCGKPAAGTHAGTCAGGQHGQHSGACEECGGCPQGCRAPTGGAHSHQGHGVHP